MGALYRDFDLDNFSGLDYNKKTDLVFVDEGLSYSAVGATGNGYPCTRVFLFVPDGCGVSGAATPANARRV